MNKFQHSDWIDIKEFNREVLKALTNVCELQTAIQYIDGVISTMMVLDPAIKTKTLYGMNINELNLSQWLFMNAPEDATTLVCTENEEYIYLKDPSDFWPISKNGQKLEFGFTTIATRDTTIKTVYDAVKHYDGNWPSGLFDHLLFNPKHDLYRVVVKQHILMSPDEYIVCTKDQFNELKK